MPQRAVTSANRLVALVQLCTFFCAAILIAASYRIWLPPEYTDFPQISGLNGLSSVGAWADWLGLGLLAASLLVAIVTSVKAVGIDAEPTSRLAQIIRSSSLAIIAAGLVLVALSQHRLQAWFYHLLLFCLLFQIQSATIRLVWLRRTIIAVYIYSAVGKLDFEFAHSVGQELLGALLSLLQLDAGQFSELDLLVLALALPLTELALALGLIFARTRRPFGMLTGVFHVVLGLLFFLKLQHSWGVVLWNLQFAIQAWLLFAVQANETASHCEYNWRGRAAVAIVMCLMTMPLLERWGYWDHWPSWALYAPHSSRTRITVARYAIDQLPDGLRELAIARDTPDAAAVQLPIADWSLQTLGVPIYPQARFQLGIARALSQRTSSSFSIEATILSPADRITGQRIAIPLHGAHEIRDAQRYFWLGSTPRQ